MNNILHQIKAYLYENLLTDDPNDYLARVARERSLNVSEICKAAVSRGGAATTAEAMEHNVNLFLKEMGYQLCDGYSVNTGYFTATTLIKGVFNSPDEAFSADKHTVVFQFNQGELLRKELANVTVDILGVADSNISITQVTDVKSGSVNDLLTPGRNLKISGYKLKVVGDNLAIGIFFANQSTGVRTQVNAVDIVTNNPSELVILIPALVAGSYKLGIVSQYSGAILLKEPRTAIFDKVLTVQ
jgi:ethanolamine utilization microcompartment shell protein EutS